LSPKLSLKKTSLFIILIFLVIPCISFAQSIKSTVQGVVTTESGEPIEAATIYVASPSLLGIQLILTEKSGFFDLPGLPPGNYSLSVEKPGYKSAVIEDLTLEANRTAFLKIKLAKAEKEGEISLVRLGAAGDIYASQIITYVERRLIDELPLGRSLASLLRASPNVVSQDMESLSSLSLLGSSWRNSSYLLDGTNITDNLIFKPIADFDSAVVEALEVTNAGQTLGQVPAGGTHLHIISRSGGNNFAGDLNLFFINDGWNKKLWSLDQLEAKNIPAVAGVKNNFEPSFTLGGPFWTDRAWFFLTSRFQHYSQPNIFLGPYSDIHGQTHTGYDWSRNLYSGFFKLTVRPIAEAQATAWVNFSSAHQPVAEDPSPSVPFLSTHLLDQDNSFSLHGSGHYFLDRNMIIEAKASYFRHTTQSLLQEAARSLFWSEDAGDKYGPLSGADYNAETMVEQLYGEASARRFVSNWGGLRHTLKAGFSFVQTTAYIDWWRENSLLWFLDRRRPNNNYYPEESVVGFWLCGAAKTTTLVRGQTQRLGGYLADTLTIGQRLTLDLSLRLDRVSGGFSAASKAISGNPLAYFVGEAVIKPYTQAAYPDVFSNGLNPWGYLGFGDRGDFISWLALSPRLGMVVNLWGDGRTLLKGSWARYHDDLTPRHLLPLHPLYPGNIKLFWLDANGDGRPDSEDEFSPQSFDFRLLSDKYFDQRIAEDIGSPRIDEFSLGAEQFFGRQLSFSLRYISRLEKNIPADVLFDLDSGKTWYDSSAGNSQNYWLPFVTTIPANGEFPAQTVTIFVRSQEAPPLFLQWRNVPELERKYQALEFTLKKKMEQGWGGLATLVWSETKGNAEGMAEPVSRWETEVIDPNYFVNRSGRLEIDRPVLFKLQAAFELPYGVNLGVFYQYQSGRPYERKARILPPADWCAQKGGERIYYSVYLEPAGSRRQPSSSFLDVRLEKALRIGSNSRLWLTFDVLNLLGNKREIVGLNDVDIWEPAFEGAGKSGQLYLVPDYQQTKLLLGQRVLRFALRLTF